jgi:hypothetical protein
MLGVLVIIVLRGTDFQTLFVSLLTLVAIELAFKRNLIFQRFIATGNEDLVLKNLVVYFLSSVFIFLIFSTFEIVLYLSLALVLVEILAYIFAISRILRKRV